MAQLVVAAAGAAIGGSLITGTVLGMTGASIGWMVGSAIGGQLFGPKGQDVQGPRLGDLRVSGTEYGQAIPWVAGSPRIAGQIIWASNKRETANTQEAGGKGGGGGGSVTTYTYDVDLLILLTANVTGGVSRIWSNGELVFAGKETKAGVWAEMLVYTGDDDQMPDPTYEAAVGVGNAPAYRGMTTVMIRGLQLGSGGQIPNLTFEIGASGGIGWLTQASAINDLGRLRTDLGSPADILSGGIDPTAVYRGLPTFAGRFQSPIEVPTTSATKNWSLEVFARPTVGWGGPRFRIQWGAWNSATGSFDVFFGPDPFNFPQTIQVGAIWSTLVSSGGGTLRDSVLLINDYPVSNWYHFAIQWAASARRLRIYFDGRLMATFGNGATPIWIDALAGLEYNSSAHCAGLVFKPELPDSALYPANLGFDVRSFVPPMARFSKLDLGFGAWYDSSPDPTALKDAIERQVLVAGIESDEFEISDQLDGAARPLRAMAISQVTNSRTVLEQLQSVWFFEASATDRINIRPRPTTSAASVIADDLGLSTDQGNGPLSLVNANELEVPAQIALSYHNMQADYAVSTEYSDRLVSGQVSTATAQLPIGMLPNEAKVVVDVMLADRMSGLGSATISVPLKYAKVEPGDIIDVTDPNNQTYRMRVLSRRDTITGLSFDCVLDSVGSLSAEDITDESYVTITDPTVIAPTNFAAMDIPLLRDADDSPGYYAAVGAARVQESDSWPGAVFVQALTPEQFERVFTSGNSATIGECLTTLPNFTMGAVFDEFSTLDVEVSGELVSSTRTAMLNDQTINAALVGNEIVRFRLATLLSTSGAIRTYRLSGFLRGGRGTERHISTHGPSEQFVLLRPSDIRRVGDTLARINLARDVKGVTLNQLLSGVTAVSFTDTGESLRPFSPANLRALADGADMDVSWQRRTRRETSYGGTVDQVVPLGEATELYRIRVFDGTTLVRTATSASTAWTYAAADIAADGFASGDPITFEIRQVSAVVGDGHPAAITRAAP